MDANTEPRETVTVTIAGRQVAMLKPNRNQLVGLSMWTSNLLDPTVKLKALTDMFLSLLPDADAQGWFMEQMMGGDYSIEDIATTLSRVATADPDGPTKPAKKVAKKTPAKRP